VWRCCWPDDCWLIHCAIVAAVIGAVVAVEPELMVDDAAADAAVPGSLLSTHSIRYQSLVAYPCLLSTKCCGTVAGLMTAGSPTVL
jgi:hypothetical protein